MAGEPIKKVIKIYGIWCGKCMASSFWDVMTKKFKQMTEIGDMNKDGVDISTFTCDNCGAMIVVAFKKDE